MSLQLALQEKEAINRVVNLSNNILRTHGEGGIDKEVMSRNNCNRATLKSQGLPTLYHPDANNAAQSAVEILTTSNTGGCNNVGVGIVDFNIRVLLQKPVADLKAIARDEPICLKGIKKKKGMATKIYETRLAKTQPEAGGICYREQWYHRKEDVYKLNAVFWGIWKHICLIFSTLCFFYERGHGLNQTSYHYKTLF